MVQAVRGTSPEQMEQMERWVFGQNLWAVVTIIS